MDMIKMAIEMYLKYVGSSLHMLLLLGALLYIGFQRQEKEHRRLFLGYVCGFAVIYFCPVTAWAIHKFVGDTYWRMFWLLPMPAVIAYAMTRKWAESRDWWKKTALLIIFAGAIILGGKNVYLQDTHFERAYNSEKIPQSAAVLVDIVNANREKGEYAKLAAPEDIAWYVRQCDGSIEQLYGRKIVRTKWISYVYDRLNKSDIKIRYKKLCRVLRKLECNYVAIRDAEGQREKMQSYEFAVIGQVGSYVIYKDVRENA
ncbi:MAG: hypothetical protein Q4B57_01950 [Eubacteriales bacterium]|nr:hypothetical protein [Eubacteriales bacterium]